jgi:uncharacterized Zn finger protein (UPF0148 family)
MIETSLEKLNQEVLEYPTQASRIVIHNNDTLKRGNEFLLAIKSMRKKIGEVFDPIIEKAHKAHKEAVSKKKEFEEPLIRAENEVKLRIASYMRKIEEERRETEEKAAEEERKRLEAQKRAEEEARFLESKGQIREAQELRDRVPEFQPAVIPEVPVLNNVQVKMIYKWEVEDINKVPRKFLTIDNAAVTNYVRIHREKTNIPGIRVFKESSVAARA